jgi:hypothetical protein
MSQNSLDLDSVNERPRRCGRCGCLAPFVQPEGVPEKRELQEMASRSETLRFMNRLQEITGCQVVNAKAVYAHMVSKRGICHWCGGEVPVVEYADCVRCESFNIWWGEKT